MDCFAALAMTKKNNKPIDTVGNKVYIKPIKTVGFVVFIFLEVHMKFYFEKLVRENFRNGVMRLCCRSGF